MRNSWKNPYGQRSKSWWIVPSWDSEDPWGWEKIRMPWSEASLKLLHGFKSSWEHVSAERTKIQKDGLKSLFSSPPPLLLVVCCKGEAGPKQGRVKSYNKTPEQIKHYFIQTLIILNSQLFASGTRESTWILYIRTNAVMQSRLFLLVKLWTQCAESQVSHHYVHHSELL